MTKNPTTANQECRSQRHERSIDEIMDRSRKILEIKSKAMKENVHYGTVPGCRQPSLWKAGAEILCQAFMLEPAFSTSWTEDPLRTIKWEKNNNGHKTSGTTQGFIQCTSMCSLVHIPTGEYWARNVSASCNNFEVRYRSLNPYDVANTLQKMSEKRSFVAVVLIGTGASDVFTQDLEDMGYLINPNGNGGSPGNGPSGTSKPKDQAPRDQSPKGQSPRDQSPREPAQPDEHFRPATAKQIAYIKNLLQKRKVPEDKLFSHWKEEFTDWSQIPIDLVNDILDWIKSQ